MRRSPREHLISHRPIVLVHGTRSSSAVWREHVDALERRGHETLALDLPGHGARSGERFSLDGALETIDDAVGSFAVAPLLVGMSLGGYVSLAYASRSADALAGVVLAGCSTETKGKPLRLYAQASSALDRLLQFGGGTWHVVEDMLGALAGYSSLADLRALRLPIWLVNGSRDPLRLDERRFLRAQPAARLTVVPGAGHDVHLEAPRVFTRLLVDALAELPVPLAAPLVMAP
jgi:pimeloyl-ACP methyl ester carboxylesterase